MSGTLTGYRYGSLTNATWLNPVRIDTLSEAMVGIVEDGKRRLAYVKRADGEVIERLAYWQDIKKV